jgi:hypothetical protein
VYSLAKKIFRNYVGKEELKGIKVKKKGNIIKRLSIK